jgi:hypothetical protein
VPSEDLNGKLECVSCGTILMDLPQDADVFTIIRCAHCQRVLGDWGEIQDEFLRVKGVFDLDHGGLGVESDLPRFAISHQSGRFHILLKIDNVM